MKKDYAILIVLFLPLFAVISCKKKKCYRDFNSSDLKQLVYTGGETLNFKSNSSLYDTVRCGSLVTFNDIPINHCPKESRSMKSISLGMDKFIINGGPCSVTIYQPYADEGPPKPKLDLYGSFNEWQTPKTMTINSKQVANVYRINSPGPGHYFNCIYWSFDHGILRFDKSDGEVWERINL